MKNHVSAWVFAAFLVAYSDMPEAGNRSVEHPADLVNVFIGTDGDDTTEYGGTIPSVTLPFGMTQWSAMTRYNEISRTVYHYGDPAIIGFVGTHQPAIWMGDYGYISVMPQSGKMRMDAVGRALPFDHAREVARPYVYSVEMGEAGERIKTEITATERSSLLRISYQNNRTAGLSIEMSRMADYEGYTKIIPETRRIIGFNADHHNVWSGRLQGPGAPNLKGYFVLEFDTDFSDFGVYESNDANGISSADDVIIEEQGTEKGGKVVGGYVSFAAQDDLVVQVKIGTSFISFEQAAENLKKEIPDWDFDRLTEKNRKKWNQRLSRIRVAGGTADQTTTFYTALFHSLLYPRVFSESGSYFSAFDGKIHNGISYNDYSLWDTFRAQHPLLHFIAPDHVSPMIQSLVQMYEQGGWLPKWPNPTYSNIMIGTHADCVIADAYIKGFRDFDEQKAYEGMLKNAMVPPESDGNNRWISRATWTSYEARGGLIYYKDKGYIPADKVNESVSRTMEFAYDDFCVAQMAKALGKTDDYDYFHERSMNYKNLFNAESGFIQPRLSSGEFVDVHDRQYRSFTEGSHWTYLFSAMHDVEGLVELMGGKTAFAKKLDENFQGGHHRHGNEPGHHYPYLYNYIEQPWKTQEIVIDILKTNYLNKPDGLSGNDDCGQMSAWYIFSAMGFYPVTPSSDEYVIGAPLFEEIVLQLDNMGSSDQKTFTIKAHDLSPENRYVEAVYLNGEPLELRFLSYSDIAGGGTLEFTMIDVPPYQQVSSQENADGRD